MTIDEGLCVQIMHHGPFDDEPATVALMDKYLAESVRCALDDLDRGYERFFKRLSKNIPKFKKRKTFPNYSFGVCPRRITLYEHEVHLGNKIGTVNAEYIEPQYRGSGNKESHKGKKYKNINKTRLYR